jgi:hypothetical protein
MQQQQQQRTRDVKLITLVQVSLILVRSQRPFARSLLIVQDDFDEQKLTNKNSSQAKKLVDNLATLLDNRWTKCDRNPSLSLRHLEELMNIYGTWRLENGYCH